MSSIKSIYGNEICDQAARNSITTISNTYKKNVYNTANGNGNSANYLWIARIVCKTTYVNKPITFVLSSRDKQDTKLTFGLVNSGAVNPNVHLFQRIGEVRAWVCKPADSTYDIYVQKSESWDEFTVIGFQNPYDDSAVSVSWKSENTASLPSGSIEATELAGARKTSDFSIKMTDDGNGNVTIKTV